MHSVSSTTPNRSSSPGLLQRCELQGRGLVVRRDAGVAVFHALHFALDICNMANPLFTGLPAMMQNLPLTGQSLPGFLLWADCLGFCDYLGEAVDKPVQKATVGTLWKVAAEQLQYVLGGAQGINQAR